MCEYKAEKKCTWIAESSRMKTCVQLGLFCLSLLISSLHGETETDNSMQIPIMFEEPDLHQPEMYRARRQTVSAEKEDTPKTGVIETPTKNGKIKKGNKPHPGAYSILKGSKNSELKVYRTKRQNKSKNKKKKTPRPGSGSLLASGVPQHLLKTARAKRDESAGGQRPWPGS